MPQPPAFINAKGTVFKNDKLVELSFSVDPATELSTYYLIRGENRNSLTDTIEIKKQQGGGDIGFEDEIPEAKPYYYQLLSMNDCGLEARRSNIASTLQLNAANAGNRNLLSWNPYIDWPGGVKNYEIYRSVDGAKFELISSGPGSSDTSFTDKVGDLILEQGASEFCYYITATEKGNDLQNPGFSKSNQICVNAESFIFMPNAFTPNGDNLNDEYKPILTFSPKSYLFIIRDRWGNTLFETDNPEIPWKGDSKGKPVPEDVYVFYVKAEDQQGKILEKTGQIMVLFPGN
jgi:gliding motility-associated-like protein